MTPTNYHDDFIAQDTAEDDSSFETGTSQPLSEAELEELLYGDGRSVAERLQLLKALRSDLADREAGDVGDDDPSELIAEIDARIAELEGDTGRGDASGRIDADPLAHRETLSPDSDELEELEEDDEASLAEDGDEEDDFDDDDDEGDVDNDDDAIH